ncbi:MAG: cation:proton antiporter family protein, partial [Patescibacteria group bacterium]
MAQTFVDVSLVIVLAAALGLLAHVLKQPTILAYLATGIIVSLFGVLNLNSQGVLDIMATFGITFLLFLVGLEMRFSDLKSVGKAIILTGLGQIFFTALIGYGIVRLLGFSSMESLFISLALTFSSTIIVIKLLSEKRDMQSLYGRIVVGFLLLQDLVAMIMLIVLSAFQQSPDSSISFVSILIIAAKIIFLFGGTLWISRKIIPAYVGRIARNQELLFIASVAWAFGVALLVSSPLIGFSIEIGGLLAGLALAQSAEQFQINARVRPLRDFFIVIFFIVLGSSLTINNVQGLIIPAIILSLFVLIGNPLIVLIIMGLLGYRRRTSFFASVTVAQISEFSFILMTAAFALGYVTHNAVALVTIVGVITIMISTYFITRSETMYRFFHPFLRFFEKKNHLEKIERHAKMKKHIILIGAHRLGQYLLKNLKPDSVIVVEFDPSIATQLKEKGYNVTFGDISDPEIQDAVHFEDAAVIISTTPNLEDNLSILRFAHTLKKRPSVIVNAQQEWEAREYYKEGADYVLYPHFVAAQHLAQLFRKGVWNKQAAAKLKKLDQKF